MRETFGFSNRLRAKGLISSEAKETCSRSRLIINSRLIVLIIFIWEVGKRNPLVYCSRMGRIYMTSSEISRPTDQIRPRRSKVVMQNYLILIDFNKNYSKVSYLINELEILLAKESPGNECSSRFPES